MKKNDLFRNLLILLSLIFVLNACDSSEIEGNESLETQDLNEIALVNLSKKLEAMELDLNNAENMMAVVFDIRFEDEEFEIENIKYMNEFEYGFVQGFNNDSNQISSTPSNEIGDVKVSCGADGESITVCPKLKGLGAGIRQARCVGEAVQKCLENGDCAEVCSAQAIMEKQVELF